MKKKSAPKAGFSLVEAVFALAVVAFCLLPVLGLLPIGLSANQSTVRETTAANLAAAVSNDLRATPATIGLSPCYGLQVPSTGSAVTNTFFLSDTGVKLAAPSLTGPTYLATVVLTPPQLAGTLNASTARILITWPALANQANGAVPVRYKGSFETVIGLDDN